MSIMKPMQLRCYYVQKKAKDWSALSESMSPQSQPSAEEVAYPCFNNQGKLMLLMQDIRLTS